MCVHNNTVTISNNIVFAFNLKIFLLDSMCYKQFIKYVVNHNNIMQIKERL